MDCVNLYRAKRRKEKPGVWKEIDKRARYKYKYGLLKPPPKFGACPICLQEKKLVVDHKHGDEGHRGIICYNCNTLIGHLEKTEKMERLYHYLNEYEKNKEAPTKGL